MDSYKRQNLVAQRFTVSQGPTLQGAERRFVLPGVEQDPRAHYIDYTRATEFEELIANIEDRLRDWFADGQREDEAVRECDVEGAASLRLMLFTLPRARRSLSSAAAAAAGASPLGVPDTVTIRETVRTQFGASEFVLLSGTADGFREQAEEEEISGRLLSALTVAMSNARRPAPHCSSRMPTFVMMDGFFRPITGYNLPRASDCKAG